MSGMYREMQKIVSQYKRVAVAFSGGVDSSFLLYAACTAIGPGSVHAFHAGSELLPSVETERVARVIHERGCFFHPLETNPLGWHELVANGPDRCYHCKKKIYQTFLADPFFAKGAVLLDGTNLDDLGQDRPGLLAVSELKVQTPLADLGFTKNEIRQISREFSLSTWNAYSSSCLATRIVTGEPITREKILLVDQCETLLRKYGFMGVRVRLCQGIATVVVLKKDLSKIQNKHVFSIIKDYFLSVGLCGIVIDQQGRSESPQ